MNVDPEHLSKLPVHQDDVWSLIYLDPHNSNHDLHDSNRQRIEWRDSVHAPEKVAFWVVSEVPGQILGCDAKKPLNMIPTVRF